MGSSPDDADAMYHFLLGRMNRLMRTSSIVALEGSEKLLRVRRSLLLDFYYFFPRCGGTRV